MQDLSIVGPFAAVGVAMIAVALAFSRQTTLSARRLDKLMAERPERRPQVYGVGTIGSIDANASNAEAARHHPAHT